MTAPIHSSADHAMTSPIDPLVEVADLVKRYPKSPVNAVDGVSKKIVFAAMRGVLAGVVMFPIGWVVLGRLNFEVQPVELLVFLVPGALTGSCLGLVLGTMVPPNRISVMFALVLTPLLFTGAAMYPWAALDSLRWFQIITLFNPLT